MGPPGSQITIGDAVNACARLESLTKDYDCMAIVSRRAISRRETASNWTGSPAKWLPSDASTASQRPPQEAVYAILKPYRMTSGRKQRQRREGMQLM
jgi:hypothetical protein